MSRSSFGPRVRAELRSPVGTVVVLVAVSLVSTPCGCDVYTDDLLMTAAGGAVVGTTATASVGGSASTAGTGSKSSSSATTLAGGNGGTDSTQTTSASSSGGVGGLTSSTGVGAHAGSETSSSTQPLAGAGMAGSGNANGGAAGSTTQAAGGNSEYKCWLDDMRGTNAAAPLKGCDSSRNSYWTTFLPPWDSIVVKPPTILPSPDVLFERQSTVADDLATLGDVQYVATVSGRVSVSDLRKYFGIRFPLYVGSPYLLRGATLHFYYRTRYSAPASTLRVNITTSATTDRQKLGGTCPQNCDDHFGYNLPNTNGNWSPWALRLETTDRQGDLTRDWTQSDGVRFDVNQVLAVEFGLSDSQQFEFSVGPIWLEWVEAQSN